MGNRIPQRLVLACGVVAFVASTLGAVLYLPTPFGQKNPDSNTDVKATPTPLPVLAIAPKRNHVPPELHWFFQRFPEISEQAVMRSKNRHTFIVHDPAHKKQYVVRLSQNERRVEVYSAAPEKTVRVHLFKRNEHRIVDMQGGRILQQTTEQDEKGRWMWKYPLWNDMHVKIFSLSEAWRDSPYKKYSCAGFVHQFLGDAGVKVPKMDAWDLAKQKWQRVAIDEIEPGDVITIRAASQEQRRRWGHSVTHVGVYLGDDKIIHASTSSPSASRSWVKVASLKTFQKRIHKIIRPPELL